MAEISGQPIVNRSDSVAASYLKSQDYQFNPTSGTANIINLNTSNVSGTSNVNFGGAFTASGHTVTAATSGIGWGPAGWLNIQVSGNPAVIPFFTP